MSHEDLIRADKQVILEMRVIALQHATTLPHQKAEEHLRRIEDYLKSHFPDGYTVGGILPTT